MSVSIFLHEMYLCVGVSKDQPPTIFKSFGRNFSQMFDFNIYWGFSFGQS